MFPNMQLKRKLLLFGLFLWSSEALRCNIGFNLRNNSCADTNECSMVPGVCGDHSQCFNTNGSYYCTCNAGFRSTTPNFTATTGECRDINECFEKTHECPGIKVCKNTIGSYECSCPPGYHETRTDSACEGLFLVFSESNTCNIGFARRNSSCVDEDECATQSPCGDHTQCVNTHGSYYCTCNKGFRSTPHNFTQTTGQCSDINECLEEILKCSGDMKCINTIGSFKCICPPGYNVSRTDSGCEDINECSDPDVCGTNADCYNYPGGYSCKCHQGYSNYGHSQSKCIKMHFCLANE